MYKDMEKNITVWDQLKDELKDGLKKSANYLDKKAVEELKTTDSYTSISYGTFNTLQGSYVRLGNSYVDSMFFIDFLKN